MPRNDTPAPPGKRPAAQVVLQATAKLARCEIAYRGYWINAWAQAVAAARDAFLPRFMLSSDPPGTAGRIWLLQSLPSAGVLGDSQRAADHALAMGRAYVDAIRGAGTTD